MAVRKEKKEVFVLATSTCGKIEQVFFNDGEIIIYPTLTAAMKDASRVTKEEQDNNGEPVKTVYVFKLVGQGTIGAISWE